MDIALILASLKAAKDTAVFVKDSKDSLSQADTKFKMAEIVSALADAQIEISNLKMQSIESDEKINELEMALNVKSSLSYDGYQYWVENDPFPFCPRCHENSHKQIHMTLHSATSQRFIPPSDYWSKVGDRGTTIPGTPPTYNCKVCDYSSIHTHKPK